MIRVESGIHRFVANAEYGSLHLGFVSGGPQDRFSCMRANRLLGNDPGVGAIELTLMAAAKVRFDHECFFMVGGAPCRLAVNRQPCSDWTIHKADAGTVLQIRPDESGCRVYLCVVGGLEQSNEAGCYRHDEMPPPVSMIDQHHSEHPQAWEPPRGTVRVTRGPEFDEAIADAMTSTWQVSPQSSGMGLRLQGPTLELTSFDILSSPVQDGTIQATPHGLIALLRQRGTLGGYPRVATVIDCDVDRLAQFRPGNQLRLVMVDQDESRKLYLLQQAALTT